MIQEKLNHQVLKIMSVIQEGKDRGVGHLTSRSPSFNGREVTISGNKLINFASCSYLGLALDKRLIEGAANGASAYGTSFPTSRSFVSLGYLDELENMLESIFGHPCLVASSTSLGHIAYLPTLVDRSAVVILDHQVHNSVFMASEILKARGCTMDIVRHGRLDLLEQKIIQHSASNKSIWYLADGVYSMYGDMAPIKELVRLLDKYPNFHVYVDDAHGMSWLGKHGKGYTLNEAPLHNRMALITSLGKGFGSIGGALVFKDEGLKELVKSCGGPFVFSSPIPASVIGASIAAADIHLSSEITELQSILAEKINYFKNLAISLELPVLGEGNTPIFFIPSGNPETCFKLSEKMMEHGFYQSPAVYPSVPVKNSGMRFTITNWIEKEDMERALTSLAKYRTTILQKDGLSDEVIKKGFKGVLFCQNQKTY